MGEGGVLEGGPRQAGQEGVGPRLPAEGLEGGQALHLAQVQALLGDGVGGQEVAADANGGHLGEVVLLLAVLLLLAPPGLVVPQVGAAVPRRLGLGLRHGTPRGLKQEGQI